MWDFRLKPRFISETAEIGSWMLWNINRKSQVADRSVPVPITLSDAERRDARGQIFRGISAINYARNPTPKTKKNRQGNKHLWDGEYFKVVTHARILRGRAVKVELFIIP